MRVEENIRAILEYQKLKPKERKELIDKTLQEFGIDSLRKQYAFSLSGGESVGLRLLE